MPTLSCEQCRARKTKCDKLAPCSACKSAGLLCHVVQRDRLPRGRTSKSRTKDTNLETRVARLEKLLREATTNVQKDPISGSHDSPLSSAQNASSSPANRLDTFVAADFWTALSDEVAGIRETLQEVSDDESTPPSFTAHGQDSSNVGADDAIVFPGMISTQDGRGLCSLSRGDQQALLDVYKIRVDSVIKPLHWPTTLRSFAQADIQDSSSPVNALRNAVYYIAVCSLSDYECMNLFSRDKSALLAEQRMATEVSISTAKILQSPDIVGLQAFVVYLQALRSRNAQALNWTLLAIVVRLAIALGLNAQSQAQSIDRPDTIELEIRRRLWYTICLMDVQATLDRGSAPLINIDDVGLPPRNVDDDDPLAVNSANSWTGMSFPLLTFEAMRCFKGFCDIPRDTDHDWSNWKRKLGLLRDLEEFYRQRYFVVDASTATPIQYWSKKAAHAIMADMRLLLRRPAFRRGKNVVPPWDDFNPLEAATESLERHMGMHHSNNTGVWSWMEWTPWYALAVALAELCRTPHGELADKAYRVAQAMFDTYSVPATHPDRGMLWKPMTKLLRRVNSLRNETVHAPPSTSGSSEKTPPMEWCDGNRSQKSGDLMPLSVPALQSQMLMPPATAVGYGVQLDGLGYDSPSSLDFTFPVPDLDPQDGVSWLDWENLMQASTNSIR